MIQKLLIKNYAIIEELEINFSSGLTIITGETGAGKSILLGALGLIMGNRADTKSLYDHEKKCIIEAYFQVKKYKVKTFFAKNEIDYDDELIIRRELTPSGKSRAFINDTPVNLKMLQQLSGSLIDLHQQFDTLDIHNVSFQLRMIDALAGNNDLLEKYQSAFQQYTSGKRNLTKLLEKSRLADNESDFLKFQLQEFKEGELIEGELERMETEITKLSNAEDIKRTLGGAFQSISESESSVISNLEEIGMALSSLRKVYPELDKIMERFDGAVLEIQDVASEFERIADETEHDGERIMEIQNRLDLIYKLQNKHHVKTVNELLSIQTDLQSKVGAFADLSIEIEKTEKDIEKFEQNSTKLADQLSKKRKVVISGFEKKVQKLLILLGMEHAQLKIEIGILEQLSSTGLDDVNYLFAPNKGSQFLPIKGIASGGELSRLTLATKSLVASAIPLPTLIFDEIDTGISGDTALKMGGILHDLADQHQVVSITHSPQVAVKADNHYFVFKKIKGDKTVTSVRLLTPEERIRAIATMLSGSPPSESALKNAKELLEF
ncbi:MAG: DNA repair protein RecN [Saprospiraceae bacterium]|nr:DNA repair protein RecN [Saprospiraceae bacterium]